MTQPNNYKVLTQFLQSSRDKKRLQTGISDYISSASSETWKYKCIDTRFRSTITDMKRRNAFQTWEIYNITYKAMIKKYDIMKLNKCFKKYKRSGSTKVRNRCVVTSYKTAFKHLGLSRIMFRQYARCGLIPGISKSTKR